MQSDDVQILQIAVHFMTTMTLLKKTEEDRCKDTMDDHTPQELGIIVSMFLTNNWR